MVERHGSQALDWRAEVFSPCLLFPLVPMS